MDALDAFPYHLVILLFIIQWLFIFVVYSPFFSGQYQFSGL